MDFGEMIKNLWDNHRGKVIGVCVGLVFGICVIKFGFWHSLFLAVCIAVGFFIGSQLDGSGKLNQKIRRFFIKDK